MVGKLIRNCSAASRRRKSGSVSFRFCMEFLGFISSLLYGSVPGQNHIKPYRICQRNRPSHTLNLKLFICGGSMFKAGWQPAVVVICLLSSSASAQDGYFSHWFARVDKTKDEQPHWITPVATTTPRLEEEFRYDQLWQTNSKGITTNNYDGGKGLELIPLEKVEVIFNLPPYLAHNDPAVQNGFGDTSFLVKYRL